MRRRHRANGHRSIGSVQRIRVLPDRLQEDRIRFRGIFVVRFFGRRGQQQRNQRHQRVEGFERRKDHGTKDYQERREAQVGILGKKTEERLTASSPSPSSLGLQYVWEFGLRSGVPTNTLRRR